MPQLTTDQARILEEMRYDWGTPLAQLAADSRVPLIKARLIVKTFEMIGWVNRGPWFNDDTGLIAGSGYYLNRRGDQAQQEYLRSIPPTIWTTQP